MFVLFVNTEGVTHSKKRFVGDTERTEIQINNDKNKNNIEKNSSKLLIYSWCVQIIARTL